MPAPHPSNVRWKRHGDANAPVSSVTSMVQARLADERALLDQAEELVRGKAQALDEARVVSQRYNENVDYWSNVLEQIGSFEEMEDA